MHVARKTKHSIFKFKLHVSLLRNTHREITYISNLHHEPNHDVLREGRWKRMVCQEKASAKTQGEFIRTTFQVNLAGNLGGDFSGPFRLSKNPLQDSNRNSEALRPKSTLQGSALDGLKLLSIRIAFHSCSRTVIRNCGYSKQAWRASSHMDAICSRADVQPSNRPSLGLILMGH